MTISDELKANILRYHHVEKWRVGTISRQLNVHHSTVKRVLSETGVSKHSILVEKSMIDPFISFILDTLDRFPDLIVNGDPSPILLAPAAMSGSKPAPFISAFVSPLTTRSGHSS